MNKITMKYLFSPISLAFIAVLQIAAINNTYGQELNLTPEQLAQLQALSPADRQALLSSASARSAQAAAQSQLTESVEVAPRSIQEDAPSAIERNAQLPQTQNRLEEQAAPRLSNQGLEQFGYELFAGSPTTFAPATDIPVPANHIMGPGDTVILQLYGQQNITHELVITREGMLLFPEIGPIAVAGLNFDELREQINEIVSTQLIGQRAAVTLGSLRSIRIFVLGEAYRPGSYTVSALSTMTNALFVSGGITNVGSLRNVQLRRQGVTVSELDLYDLLLKGDTSADQRLLPDDVLFIPPVGSTVGVAGEVIRPAIYELKSEVTAEEVLALSGGLLPTAFPTASKIERINELGLRTVVDVDLSASEGQHFQVRNGDRIEINPVLDQLENVVLTEGHLQRPGGFQWREGLRVSDVIPSVSILLPNPDLQYALIVRQQQPTRTSIVLKLELGNAIANPGSSADIVLQANDRIITFGNTESRQENLEDLLQELNAQASFNNPAAVVAVQGNVRFPGEYPYLENMSVGDMLNSAGGLLENSDEEYALIVKKKNNQGAIEIEDAIGDVLSINSDMSATRSDMLLVFEANAPRGELLVDVVTQLKSQSDSIERSRVVRISGQVRFPGEYPLYDGMTVEGLLRAAGGFTESALTSEAELTRYFVQGKNGRQVDHLDVDIQSEGVLGQNLRLAEFDSLMIKQLPNWNDMETIQISGEVVSPGVYSVSKGESLSSVIRRAGGLTGFADPNASVLLRATLREKERELLEEYEKELQADIAAAALENNGEGEQEDILIVGENLLEQVEDAEPLGRLAFDMQGLLNGNQGEDVIVRNGDQLFIVVAYDSSRWFFERETALRAGDTIVVPFDIEPVDYLVTWSSVSQILFNLATSVLAINSVQN